MNHSGRTKYVILAIVAILLLAGAAYWYFTPQAPQAAVTAGNNGSNGFQPLDRGSGGAGQNTNNPSAPNNPETNPPVATPANIPALRLLSAAPIGGYGASTTAGVTVIRWIDRGRGNIYETRSNSLDTTTLSNTIVPMTYWSAWNKNLTAFISSLLQDGSDETSTVYAELRTQTSTTTADGTSVTPFELKGKNLPSTIASFAVSPKKDKVFLFSVEGGRGIGYTAPFNGGAAAQIFDTPLTQVNVDWPEDNTIAITTKGTASQSGFLYFVDPKTGVWKKILGPVPGLSAKVSRDAKYAIISAAGNNGPLTSIYDIAKKTGTDAVIRTLADKCAWGNFYKDIVYCGVPSAPVPGTYPDDWYKGTLSTADKIWQVKAPTGEVHLIAPIADEAGRPVDTFNLGLDDKDAYLFFMNKNDLSFWSLDLVSGN